MKKYLIYIVVLVIGILLGRFVFGGNSSKIQDQEASHNHQTEMSKNQKWTCSMHPQIMQDEAGACPICGMDLIPAVTDIVGLAADQFKLTDNAIALANIQTAIIGNEKQENKGAILTGKISANGDKTANQPAHFNGRIEKLYINSLGEKVKMGQAIAVVYSQDLVNAQQELITAYRLKESQPQLYKAVKNKFKNWKIHDAQLAEVEKTGKVKTKFTLYSHVTGVVSEITATVGSHIMDGHSIFKVSNLSSVWANFDVYEHEIGNYKKGQEITVITKAYPNKVFKAKISFIDPILNETTRTVNLRVVLNNKERLLKPGMFIQGSVKDIEITNTTVYVPTTAVLWTGKRSVVYVKPNPNTSIFEMREITLGNNTGNNFEVKEGLKNGEEIVVNGTFTVDAAAQLLGKKSVMNRGSENRHKGMQMSAAKPDKLGSNNNPNLDRFREQLNSSLLLYLKLKDALTKDQVKEAHSFADKLNLSLDKIDMKLLQEEADHKIWKPLLKEIKSNSIAISKNTDIKKQREFFKPLSNNIISAIQRFGINETLYIQFCPMADNNNGATWISKTEEINNPYFGAAMHNCGCVQKTINK